jgi:hypothetical protein
MDKCIVNLYKQIVKGNIITTRSNDRDLINISKKLMIDIYNPNIDDIGNAIKTFGSWDMYDIKMKFEIYQRDKKYYLNIIEITDIIGKGRYDLTYKDYKEVIKYIENDIGEIEEKDITGINFKELEMEKLYKGDFFMQIHTEYIAIDGEKMNETNEKYYLTCYDYQLTKFEKDKDI